MASFINKRQQARNERTLQDLIRNVPGNDRCADCQTKNPGWASWSLGIFLCMRCATLHRKLGTHISKVKSLSMDTWSNDQVENMKKVGNTASNKNYNPRNVIPTLPLDPDEIDIAVEKFIRAKYQRRTLSMDANSSRSASRNDTGSSGSLEERPPPVPAKNTPRFAPAVRSASSNYPVATVDRPLPPIRDTDSPNQGAYQDKLAKLRDVGFLDEKRNLTLLKGLNGDVDKTIETLVRLGDGNDMVRINASARNNIPLPPRTDSRGPPANGVIPSSGNNSNGGSFQFTQPAAPIAPTNYQSQIQTAQNTSYNPFETQTPQRAATQPVSPLETSFQSLHMSQQPLFPNNSGPWQAQNQHNPFLKTFTPPISPSLYQNYNGFAPDQVPHPTATNPITATNPFLKTSRSQTFHPSNPYGQNPQGLGAYWPDSTAAQYEAVPMPPVPPWVQTHRSASQPQLQPPQFGSLVGQLPNTVASSPQSSPFNSPMSQSFFSPPTLSQQQSFTESPYQSPAMQSPLSTGLQNTVEYPFNSQPLQPNQPYSQAQLQPQSQAQPQMLQQQFSQPGSQAPAMPTRLDKNSILALYNRPYAQPASQASQQQSTLASPGINTSLTGIASAQISASPVSAGASNPFARLAGESRHGREESKDFSSLALSSNANGGRHSPDAFKGLSSRFQ